MKPTTYQELETAVRNKEITIAIDKAGKKHRLFIATNGLLCRFKPKSSRRGYYIDYRDFDNYIEFKAPQTLSETDKLKKQYNVIAKYKRLAQQATFTNRFIEDCKKIPNFDEWIKEPKGLYELGITTGNKIDGKVVSIDRIAKKYRHYAEQLREAIRTQTAAQICYSVPFAGYDMGLSTVKTETGEFIGYLSLEFKGCGNGYYYLLINDNNFIGYDVD